MRFSLKELGIFVTCCCLYLGFQQSALALLGVGNQPQEVSQNQQQLLIEAKAARIRQACFFFIWAPATACSAFLVIHLLEKRLGCGLYERKAQRVCGLFLICYGTCLIIGSASMVYQVMYKPLL